MNEIKEKSFIEIIDDLENCEYVFNDEIASHCLKLSSDDIQEILDVAYNDLESNEGYVIDDINPYCVKKAQELEKNILNTLDALNDIKRIVMNSENACKCDFYEEYEEDENGEMIYRCRDCDSTFYKYDD